MNTRSLRAFVFVFPVVYAIVYAIAVENNYALFTYHPALEEFGFLVERPKDGPAMYWYGWMGEAGTVKQPHPAAERFVDLQYLHLAGIK